MPSRFLAVLFILGLSMGPASSAPLNTEKYRTISYGGLTALAASYGVYSLDRDSALMEYLQVTNCDKYKILKDNTFQLQEFRQQMAQQIQARKANPDANILYLRVPALFRIQGYNFDTQAIKVLPDFQLNNVNTIDLYSEAEDVCDKANSQRMTEIPSYFGLRLNFPVSLRRIPVRRQIAEALFPKLDKLEMDPRVSIIYGIIYVQVESVPPVLEKYMKSYRAVFRGQVDMIEFYADQNRRALIKRLNYEASY